MTIGDRLKKRRIQMNLTLLEVAEYLEVKEATVSRYESGSIKSVPYETIEKLAELFKCTPAALMGWDSFSTKDLTDKEKEMLSAFRKATPEARMSALMVLKANEK